jgi:hypothetical protein
MELRTHQPLNHPAARRNDGCVRACLTEGQSAARAAQHSAMSRLTLCGLHRCARCREGGLQTHQCVFVFACRDFSQPRPLPPSVLRPLCPRAQACTSSRQFFSCA